jgi:UDP-N-acetylglucosamine/UDP-N-acetyl-alpha-D-glucosaminouronate 4-epimerase
VRVLVTGAAGFIGSHLCRRLVAEGHEVVGFDDLSEGDALTNLADVSETRLVEGDLRDRVAVAKAATGCEVLFHHAARKSVPRSIAEPEAFAEVNVGGTLNVLLAARAEGAAVVSASSSSVYGDQDAFPLREDLEPRPRSPYAATKLAGEGLARAWWHAYGVPTVSFRYFNVYGPYQDPASEYAAVIPRFATACLSDAEPVIYGDGEQARDFTFVDDVVEANLRAARAPSDAFGRVLNVGGGREPTSVNELLRLIAAAAGAEVEARFDPTREGDIRRSHADVALARTLLGYEPKVAVNEGVRRTVAWFASRAVSVGGA